MRYSKFLFMLVFAYSSTANARDLGMVATTFKIKEQCFLSMLQDRLARFGEDDLLEHQKKIQEIARREIHRPKGMVLPRAEKHRSFLFDPSLTVARDIKVSIPRSLLLEACLSKAHRNILLGVHEKVLIPKGTRANPLDHISLSQPLVFFDGDDPKQVAYAASTFGLLILTKGAPLEIEVALKRRVYFDQKAVLVKRLGIKALPARIFQRNKVLIVEEVVL